MTTPPTTSSSSFITTEMATPSAFSYAQAAKGQGTPPSAASTTSASQAQDSPSAPATTKPIQADEPSTEAPDAVRSVDSEKQDVDHVPETDGDARSESIPDRRSESRRDDDSERLNRPWRRNDKGTRSSSATTHSLDETDSRRPRRGKKARQAEKQAGEQAGDKEPEAEPEAPKIELSEAPIPSVNIWHQRKEAQLAKVQSPPTGSSQVAHGVADSDESGRAAKSADDSTSRETAAVNGAKPARKVTDAPRPERNGSRGSRLADKDAKTGAPPSVEDAASWPTPETAIKEEKKKPTEKDLQDDSANSKPRQKEKWVTYDYVPTVSFETQLPQLRGSKPRGGARGPSGARAPAANQASEKPASAPGSKPNESKDKPRDVSNGANGATASAQPGKRASMDVSSTRDHRKPANNATAEKTKDSAPAHAAEQGQNARDRHEGRNERGRGGYRGRGGHHSVNSHSQHQPINGGAGFAPGNGNAPRAQGPYSPPGRQGNHGQGFMPQAQRGGRGGRNGNANYHRMSLPNGSSRVPPVQTQFSPYDYPMPPMSAMPYQAAPQWDTMVPPLLKTQIEYYFSIENLCKDVYLRKRMDSQGFVPLHFVAGFKRVRILSGDITLIRAICEESNEIEYVVGDDDCERLRRRKGWEQFVMPLEERDELARNHGPAHFTPKTRSYMYGPQYNGMPGMPYGIPSPPAYYPHGEQPMQQFADDQFGAPATNGMVNGHGVSQLSADVPDFSPSGPGPFGQQDASTKSTLHPEAAPVIPDSHSSQEGVNGLSNGVHATQNHEQTATQS
ncbi:HTH La-type RNA-binding protein [Paramyrothecium foliicola]|nr:HTH La-type RNA-binding protein [Paramyrothecium foliicola]